jgi:two-component system NtrC family sensor kinase
VAIVIRDGNSLVPLAHRGPIPITFAKWPITREWVTGRAFVDCIPIHVVDLLAARDEFPEGYAMALQQGHRTILVTPLKRANAAIGAIILRRLEVRPFTEKEIEMVATFADQAAIAIVNARLFEDEQTRTEELGEALRQQTATAEVLKVISRSTFDLQAVLTTLVRSATELCRATQGVIFLRDGEEYRAEAEFGTPAGFFAFLRAHPRRPGRETFTGRTALLGTVVHIPDVLTDPEYDFPHGPEIGQYRAALGVPLTRDDVIEGVFALSRAEPVPFTDKQIALVQTFADQAVIAIENGRLFEQVQARTRDVEETLEHQTATSEVLSVISRSPTEVGPVLESVLNWVAVAGEA